MGYFKECVSSLCSLQHCACSGSDKFIHFAIQLLGFVNIIQVFVFYFFDVQNPVQWVKILQNKIIFKIHFCCVFYSCLLSWGLVLGVQTLLTTVPYLWIAHAIKKDYPVLHSLALVFSVFDMNACCIVYACTLSVRFWPISWWPKPHTSHILLLQTNPCLPFETPMILRVWTTKFCLWVLTVSWLTCPAMNSLRVYHVSDHFLFYPHFSPNHPTGNGWPTIILPFSVFKIWQVICTIFCFPVDPFHFLK